MNKKLVLSSLFIVAFAMYVLVAHNGVIVPFVSAGRNGAPTPVSVGLVTVTPLPLPPLSTLEPTPFIEPGEGGDDGSTLPVSTLSPTPTGTPLATVALTPAPTAAPTAIAPTLTPVPSGKYRDGAFTGSVQDAYYGNVQVRATVQGGAITAVDFLQYPDSHRTSVQINSQAMPMLSSEAIQAQSSQVDVISGATATSDAFQLSLADALSQAMN